MSEEPEHVLIKQRVAALGRIHEMRADGAVVQQHHVLATITAGMAKITMNDCTSIDQQNSGMRFSDIPGARILKIVAISSTATHSAEISVKVIICAQTSTRFARRELRAGKRRIRKPAGVRDRCCVKTPPVEKQPADQVHPVAEGVQPREGDVARPEHQRHEIDAHALHHRHGEQEHHRGAVQW